MNLFIISGEIGIGKSTVCTRIQKITLERKMSCGGIITRKTARGEIEAEDLQTGRKVLLAGLEDCGGPVLGNYHFIPAGIQFGRQSIHSGFSADLLFIDELGILELRGEGFYEAIQWLNSEDYRTALVVIRKNLLASFLDVFHTIPRVFEVTEVNRNQIADTISSQIGRTAD